MKRPSTDLHAIPRSPKKRPAARKHSLPSVRRGASAGRWGTPGSRIPQEPAKTRRELKRSLDESRTYNATLVESARESIVILDSSLRVITANDAFYKTFLITPFDTEGRFIHQICGGQWDISYLRTALENMLVTHARVDDLEVRGEFPHIGPKVMSVNARRIESQSGNDAILLAIEDLTQLKRSEQALRDLSARLLQTQDFERRRIARDLHDITGQKVAALHLNLGLLGKKSPQIAKSRIFQETRDLAAQITEEIRSLSYILHPPLLDQLGLVPALREYIQGIASRTELEIELDVEDPFPRLPDGVETTIFRLVQECLTNVNRHSGAARAVIRLAHSKTQIVLHVQDFGPTLPSELGGASAEKSIIVEGVGIGGMRERVKLFGGTLQVSTAGQGTTVTACIPFTRSDS
jgi:two-component system, NarL family, sensor kinase